MTSPTDISSKRKPPLVALLITIIVLAAILVGLYLWRSALSNQQQGWQQQALPVTAMQVQEATMQPTLSSVAELRAINQVQLRAEAAGRVTQIAFESGQQLSPDRLLVELFSQTEKADLKASQAQLTYTQRQYQRAKELVPSGAESEDVLNQREYEYRRTQAEIEAIKAQLRLKQVRTPFAGVVGIRQVDLGDYVSPGDLIATYTELSQLFVEFSLPQSQLANIAEGAALTLTTDAYPDHSYKARVSAIEPQVDTATRNFRVRGILENTDQQLRPGMFVNASIDLPQQRSVIRVPLTAVQSSAQGHSVVTIASDTPLSGGHAQIVPVELGRQFEQSVIISSGIEAGDVIVIGGQNRIQPKAPLTVAKLVEAQGDK